MFLRGSGQVPEWCQSWGSVLQFCRAALDSPRDPKSKKIRELADQHQLRYWRAGMVLGYVFSTANLGLELVRKDLLRFIVEGPSARVAALVLFEGSIPTMVLFVLFASLFFSRPYFRTMAHVHLTILGIVLMSHFNLSIILDSRDSFDAYRHIELLFRVVALLGSNSNAFVLAINGYSGIAHAVLRGQMVSINGGQGCIMSVIVQEVFDFLIASFVAIQFRHFLYRHLMALLEAQSSSLFERAVENLMLSMCDAVVHLDSNLIVTRPARLLGALVLKQSSADLVSTAFLDFLKEDRDKESFQEFVQREDQGGHAGALHVDLRDTWGAAVRVQIFHTQFSDALNANSHIIGIRESGDFLDRMGPEQTSEPIAELQDPKREVSGESISEIGVDHAAPVLPLCAPLEHPDEVTVWVDTAAPGWPMLKCTMEFTKIGGASLRFKSPMLSWIRQGSRFPALVQEAVNDLLEPDNENVSMIRNFFDVKLFPNHMRKHHLKADIKISVDTDDTTFFEQTDMTLDTGHTEAPRIVRITLQDVTVIRGSKKRGAAPEVGQRQGPLLPAPALSL